MEGTAYKRYEIKNKINRRIKLINISYKGINSDDIKIGIQKILKEFSHQISIPSIEKFDFFDFNNARDEIKDSSGAIEFTNRQLERVDAFEDEFKKFKRILLKMNTMEKSINSKFICGTYNRLKLIYTKDLIEIERNNEILNKAKQEINMNIFNEGITSLTMSFKYKIRGELKRHGISEEDPSLESCLQKSFRKVEDTSYFFKRIKINCKYIVDISDEILKDQKFINEIDNMKIEDEDRELIKEYNKLIR